MKLLYLIDVAASIHMSWSRVAFHSQYTHWAFAVCHLYPPKHRKNFSVHLPSFFGGSEMENIYPCEKVHDPGKLVYVCSQAACGRSYNSLSSFKKHQAMHSAEEGQLDCKICRIVLHSQVCSSSCKQCWRLVFAPLFKSAFLLVCRIRAVNADDS